MIDQEEPQRLFESPEAPADLRSLLMRAHEDVPTALEKAQLVESALGHGAGQRPPVHGRGSTMRWAAKVARRSTRLWSVAAIVGVGAGALYVAGMGPRAPLHAAKGWPVLEDRAAALVEPLAGPTAGAPPFAEGLPALARPSATAPAPAAMRPRTRRPTGPAAAANASGTRSEGRSADSGGAPRNATPPPRAREITPAAPAPDRPAPQPQAAPAEVLAPHAPAAAQEDVVESAGAEEASLLRAARQALARSPRRTLSLTNEHRLRFPHGMLAQEREALAIEALIELGRMDEARPRAQAFALAYPGSPHQARLQRALVAPPAVPAPPAR